MSTTLQTNELTLRTSIIQKINLIFNDEEYTFEAFILMKGNHILKKFVLYEGVPQRRNDTSVNFKKKLQLSIAESIRRKFADESAEYDHVDNIANNQNKFYVKVADYISRSKLTYAKKMLRIKNSKVLTKSKEELYLKITTLPRWSGKFDLDEETHTIVLRNYGQVENLIDLLDERYTRSDVTDEEYDTSAKKWVEPASQ